MLPKETPSETPDLTLSREKIKDLIDLKIYNMTSGNIEEVYREVSTLLSLYNDYISTFNFNE